MVAGQKEAGHSLQQTVSFLNRHNKLQGSDVEFTVSAVSSLF